MVAALYCARVSSGRQENEETIQSQVAELRARMMEDGVADPQGFTDEGYSRDNLVRPGLDRERDLAAQQELEQLYIHSPDRLASGAKLIFLVEEFQKAGVEVIFLTLRSECLTGKGGSAGPQSLATMVWTDSY